MSVVSRDGSVLGVPERVLGNLFIRENRMPTVGDIILGHAHTFDHVSIVLDGAVEVRCVVNGEPRVGRFGVGYAQRWAWIGAGIAHEVEALLPNTLFWCVYSHRDPQGRVVQRCEPYEGYQQNYG